MIPPQIRVVAHGEPIPKAKTCSSCGLGKSLECFYKRRDHGGRAISICKSCHKSESTAWRNANRERVRKLERLRYHKDLEASREKLRIKCHTRYWKNPEKIRLIGNQYRKQWRKNNPEKSSESARRLRLKNLSRYRDRARLDQRKRRLILNNKIIDRLRSRIWMAFQHKRNCKRGRTVEMLGCSIADFKIYIESKFEVGMSWGNYGRSGWHIDHIIPCALFDLSKPEHQKRCFHFSNMQPMWASQNIRKGHRPTTNQFNLL